MIQVAVRAACCNLWKVLEIEDGALDALVEARECPKCRRVVPGSASFDVRDGVESMRDVAERLSAELRVRGDAVRYAMVEDDPDLDSAKLDELLAPVEALVDVMADMPAQPAVLAASRTCALLALCTDDTGEELTVIAADLLRGLERAAGVHKHHGDWQDGDLHIETPVEAV